MKHILKSECPEGLFEYLAQNPDATWENFVAVAQEAHAIVQDTIKKDQLGICCYCEIDFDVDETSHMKDFRVEHFYPKSKTLLPNTKENAHLTWSNLLGCCHGGTQRLYFKHDERFIKNKRKRHCDADKGEHDWTTTILNPLKIPPDAKIFTFESDGKMIVDKQCPMELKGLAQNSIDKLNLNEETYLKNARKIIRDGIAKQFGEFIQQGFSEEQALDRLRAIHLSDEIAVNMKFYTLKKDFVSY